LLPEFDAMLASVQEASFGELDQNDLDTKLRSALREKLKAENPTSSGYNYAYVRAVFQTFFVAREEWYDGTEFKSGYYKRPYSVSGTTVTVGDRGISVELAWVAALESALESVLSDEQKEQRAEVVQRAAEADDLLRTVARVEPTQEALAVDAPLIDAIENSGSLADASFNTGVIEGIIPIKPGVSKNRKHYPAEVLKRDVRVFEGLPVFYDHQDPTQPKPLKNVIGVLENARWDETAGVPRADLRYPNSMEAVVGEIREKHKLLGGDRVGFSIDMKVKAKVGRHQGMVVHSVEAMIGGPGASTDVVFNPAAGGTFDKALEAEQETKETGMTPEELAALQKATEADIRAARPDLFPAVQAATTTPTATQAAPAVETVSMETIDQRIEARVARMVNEQAFRTRVTESGLPQRVQEAMLRDAETKDFNPQFTESIYSDWSNIAAAGAGGVQVNVPGANGSMGRLSVTENADIRYARLLGAGLQQDQEVNGRRVKRFTSFREAVLAFRPDLAPMIWSNPNQFALESLDLLHWGGGELGHKMDHTATEAIMSTTFNLAWADVMNKVLAREMADPNLSTWRDLVSDFVSFSDLTNTKKIIRVGDYPDIDDVSEGAPYQFIDTPGEEKVEFGIGKKGNLEKFTWEAALADDLSVLARIPRKLALAWAWTVYRFVYSLLTANSGDGATMDYDSKELFHADHNNASDTAFSVSALLTVCGYMTEQKDITQDNPKLYEPKYLCYSNNVAMKAAIFEALRSEFKVDGTAAQINLPNVLREIFNLEPRPVYYPNGSATRWEVVADPRAAQTLAVGFLHGNENPEIFVQDMERVGSVFNSDQITYKIRGTIGADVIDHRSFARGRK
jgi:hypothetical protein